VEKKSFATKRLLNDEKAERPAKKYGSKTGGKYAGSSYGDRPDKKFVKRYTPKKNEEGQGEKDGKMRLNKFLSNAGIASRRDADSLIELGLVKVNGKVVTELGLKVDPRVDVVSYDDKSLKPERLQYVLLNKPKDFITTMDDEKDRRTVMTLVEGACKERIYPVGRLDRHTTGLLLFTNDGNLAKSLTHPKHGIPKLYHVELTTKVRGEHLDAIRDGLKLEDGVIKADEVSFVNDDPFNVGIRIHSGKNRIVRRIFEHFGYVVKKLDRVMFAGLTKKDLPRGRYRLLSEREVSFLKMIK
jgi:23S rRNA pseudouridine2605 synthase